MLDASLSISVVPHTVMICMEVSCIVWMLALVSGSLFRFFARSTQTRSAFDSSHLHPFPTCADLWEYTPATTSSGASGTWRQLISNNGVAYAPLIRFQSAYDSARDNLWIWHGVYEKFNTALNPAVHLYKWTWNQTSNAAISDTTVGYWTVMRMNTFASRPSACSWYYNSQLWMFGGVLVVDKAEVIQNGVFAASVVDGSNNPLSSATNLTWVEKTTTLGAGLTPSACSANGGVECRYGHHCQVASKFPYLNVSTPGLLVSGGYTYAGPTNELLWLDFATLQWTQIKPPLYFPMARTAHVTAVIGLHILMFGGQDVLAQALDDLWSCDFTTTADGTDVTDMVWTPVRILSPSKPPARTNSAAAAMAGQMYVFGGAGTAVAGQAAVLGDLWRFDFATSYWKLLLPTTNTGSTPVGRQGHSFERVGDFLWMYGGITAIAQTDELWRFDPITISWFFVRPAFQNALWPMPRAFHTATEKTVFITQGV